MSHNPHHNGDVVPPNRRIAIAFAIFHGLILPSLFVTKALFHTENRVVAVLLVLVGFSLLVDAFRQGSTAVDLDGIRQWSPFGRKHIAFRDVLVVNAQPVFVIVRSRDTTITFARWRFVHDDEVVTFILRHAKKAHCDGDAD